MDNTFEYLKIFHTNIGSLSFHIEALEQLVTQSFSKFNLIGITEARLSNLNSSRNKVHIPNYSIEFTPKTTEKGGALLYIKYEINI